MRRIPFDLLVLVHDRQGLSNNGINCYNGDSVSFTVFGKTFNMPNLDYESSITLNSIK